MPEALEQNPTFPRSTEIFYPSSTDDKEIIYPEQREDDMGETSIHAKLVNRFCKCFCFFSNDEITFLFRRI